LSRQEKDVNTPTCQQECSSGSGARRLFSISSQEAFGG